MRNSFRLAYLILLLSVGVLSPASFHLARIFGLSRGQTIYVPTYSHIYSGDHEKPFLLTATLSIRNIDPKHSMKITTVDYYDTHGNLLKQLLEKSVTLTPLESIRYVIPEKDDAGGSGANFMVEWTSDTLMNPPIVEAIMIGARSQQGVSFSSRGQVILPSVRE